ncbi:hypothetical protein CHISP_0311 [Chitinispirillum alkaliphilum]|nr:hypothetical protein CHISP_0311 [Chitinispirillum alkaliphilum]
MKRANNQHESKTGSDNITNLMYMACIAMLFIFSQQLTAQKIQSREVSGLKSDMTSLEWFTPLEAKDEGFRVYRATQDDESSMRETVRRLFYVKENYSESEHSLLYLLELSHNLVELQEDRLALYWINKLINHPRSKGFTSRSYWMSEIDCAQKKGHYLLLKVYSRNGLTKEADQLIQSLKPSMPKEHLMIAKAYAVMGMRQKAVAALQHCITSGEHIPYEGTTTGPHNPGWVMNQKAVTRASAAVLAFGLGNLDLAKRIAEPVVNDEKLKTHAWTSRRVSWKVLNDIYHLQNTLSFTGLKDGTYTGVGYGFDDYIKVEVIVKGGKISDVKVLHTEEGRPYNSIEAMPKRLISYNGIADGVSGATVSSNAIVMAVYDALLKSE